MVINRTGATYEYEGVTYTIGAKIQANSQSDWEGLFGVITEIRDGKDKETENETPDIYCSFDEPVLECDIKELEEHFSELYQVPKKLEDIPLDEVIMAPEMIQQLQEKLVQDVACRLRGTIVDANVVHRRIIRIKPIEHHYEEEGEKPCIKYGCPVCEAFGNRHSFYKGKENCSLCGVNFEWDTIN